MDSPPLVLAQQRSRRVTWDRSDEQSCFTIASPRAAGAAGAFHLVTHAAATALAPCSGRKHPAPKHYPLAPVAVAFAVAFAVVGVGVGVGVVGDVVVGGAVVGAVVVVPWSAVAWSAAVSTAISSASGMGMSLSVLVILSASAISSAWAISLAISSVLMISKE